MTAKDCPFIEGYGEPCEFCAPSSGPLAISTETWLKEIEWGELSDAETFHLAQGFLINGTTPLDLAQAIAFSYALEDRLSGPWAKTIAEAAHIPYSLAVWILNAYAVQICIAKLEPLVTDPFVDDLVEDFPSVALTAREILKQTAAIVTTATELEKQLPETLKKSLTEEI